MEKMLQLAHLTSAPRMVSVSTRTAVWTVMWSEPLIRAPARGCSSANSARRAIRPGISCSARRISLRPNSYSAMSATRWSSARGGKLVELVMTTPVCYPCGMWLLAPEAWLRVPGLGSSDAVRAAADRQCYRSDTSGPGGQPPTETRWAIPSTEIR